jgi:tetratricopeptide (TPR) repeat protein
MKIKLLVTFAVLLSFSSCAQKMHMGRLSKKELNQISEREFVEGMKQYVLGNNSEAYVQFEAAYKRSPENAGINYMLAKILLKNDNNFDQALVYAQKALKLDPKNQYYYQLVAEIYEKQQNYTEAIKIIKRLVTEVPSAEEYYYELADLNLYQKNYEESLRIYNKVDNIFGKSLEVTRQKQQIYLKMNKLDLAIKEGEELIATFPEESEYKLALAEMLFSNDMLPQAIKLIEQVIKDEPENPYARYILSSVYRSQKEHKKANEQLAYVFKNPEMDLDIKIDILSDLLRVAPQTDESKANIKSLSDDMMKAHPHDAKAYSSYADMLLMQGNKEGALVNYLHAKQLDNTNFNLWTQIVNLDSELNKTDSIIAHSEEALELFPNQAILWLYNGSAYYNKKNFLKAVESLEEGKNLASNNGELLNQFNLQLGDTYNEAKEYKKSDEAFEAALKYEPNNEHALNNYSYFLSLRKEKLELAKELSGKLIRKTPQASYLDTHAWVLYQLKEYEEAKKFLELALNSNNGTIIEHYGDVLFKLGMVNEAIVQWKKAKSLGETSDLINKKIADKKLYE